MSIIWGLFFVNNYQEKYHIKLVALKESPIDDFIVIKVLDKRIILSLVWHHFMKKRTNYYKEQVTSIIKENVIKEESVTRCPK